MNSQMQLDCQKRYREKHKAEIAVKDAAYYQAHRAAKAAQQKAYRAANRENVLAQQKAYREAHHEEILARRALARQKPTGFCDDCGDECEGFRCPRCTADHEEMEPPKKAPYQHTRHKFIFTGIEPCHDSDAELEWNWMRGQGVYQELATVAETASKGFLGNGLLGYCEGKAYRVTINGIEEVL